MSWKTENNKLTKSFEFKDLRICDWQRKSAKNDEF